MIGDDIVLTVIAIDRGKLRLGIEAPRTVSILRSELLANDGAGKLGGPNVDQMQGGGS